MTDTDLLTTLEARRPFPLDIETLPTVPGEQGEGAVLAPVLAARLWELLAAAGSNVIPAPTIKPVSSLPEEFETIFEAAAAFDIMPQVSLQKLLWTRSGPYWNGDIGRVLRDLPRQNSELPPSAAVLLYAQGAGRRAALLGHAQPFVVTGEILGDLEVPGPFLVLLQCRLDALGKAEPVRGYAQAILGSQNFMPVRSAFERDVFKALIALQAKLDTHGLDCSIRRDLRDDGPASVLEISIARDGDERYQLRVQLNRDHGLPGHTSEMDVDMFDLTPDRFANGAFVAWLEDRIGASGSAEAADVGA